MPYLRGLPKLPEVWEMFWGMGKLTPWTPLQHDWKLFLGQGFNFWSEAGSSLHIPVLLDMSRSHTQKLEVASGQEVEEFRGWKGGVVQWRGLQAHCRFHKAWHSPKVGIFSTLPQSPFKFQHLWIGTWHDSETWVKFEVSIPWNSSRTQVWMGALCWFTLWNSILPQVSVFWVRHTRDWKSPKLGQVGGRDRMDTERVQKQQVAEGSSSNSWELFSLEKRCLRANMIET